MRAAGRLPPPPPCATTLEFQMVTCLNCKYVCQPSTHVRVTFSDPFFRLVTPGETPSGANVEYTLFVFCIWIKLRGRKFISRAEICSDFCLALCDSINLDSLAHVKYYSRLVSHIIRMECLHNFWYISLGLNLKMTQVHIAIWQR